MSDQEKQSDAGGRACVVTKTRDDSSLMRAGFLPRSADHVGTEKVSRGLCASSHRHTEVAAGC